MDRIIFIFRLAGILFLPVIALVLGAVIWQNSDVMIEEFSLLGGWWQLESVRLSDLLVWFLCIGASVVLGFLLLLHNERKLRLRMQELRSIKKEHNSKPPKAGGSSLGTAGAAGAAQTSKAKKSKAKKSKTGLFGKSQAQAQEAKGKTEEKAQDKGLANSEGKSEKN